MTKKNDKKTKKTKNDKKKRKKGLEWQKMAKTTINDEE